jgi:hypothetical protein
MALVPLPLLFIRDKGVQQEGQPSWDVASATPTILKGHPAAPSRHKIVGAYRMVGAPLQLINSSPTIN